jgi:hypothetical protein
MFQEQKLKLGESDGNVLRFLLRKPNRKTLHSLGGDERALHSIRRSEVFLFGRISCRTVCEQAEAQHAKVEEL